MQRWTSAALGVLLIAPLSGLPAATVAAATVSATSATTGSAAAADRTAQAGVGPGAGLVAPALGATPLLGSAVLDGPAPSTPTGIAPVVTELPVGGRVLAAGDRRSARVSVPVGSRRFQTVGVTWARGSARAAVTVKVRTHGRSGWSRWHELDVDEATLRDAALDGATGTGSDKVRDGTGSRWVGVADGAQATVTAVGRLPQDLRFVLVDPGTPATSITTSSTAATAATATTAVTAYLGGRATAGSGVAAPAVLGRAAWGADESMVRGTPTYMSTVRAAVVHHTAGPNGYSRAAVPSIIRGDYAFHVRARGWSDLGYNALVDRFGRTWEGRAGGLDRNVMGAHAGGFNADTFGVAVIGSYQYAKPSPAVTTALGRLIGWKLDVAHRDPNGTARLTSAGGGTARYRAGTTVRLPAIMGHRDTGFTECPGGNLYRRLDDVRAVAAAAIPAALVDPAPPPGSVAAGTAVTVRATALRAQTWRLDVTSPCDGTRVARVTGTAAAGARVSARWDGTVTRGGYTGAATPGRYTWTLTSGSARGTARPLTGSVLVLPPTRSPETAATPSAGAGGYVPVVPSRLVDTRDPGEQPLGPNGRLEVQVTGRGQVPSSGVTAVALTLTATCVSDTTELYVWPTGGTRSTLPVTTAAAGGTRTATVVTRVGADGRVTIGNLTGVTQLAVHTVGYFTGAATGSPMIAVAPRRVHDSRTTGGALTAETREITLPDTVDGVPAGSVEAVLVDVGGVSGDRTATLTAHALDDVPPAGVTTTFSGGPVADGLALVPVTGGRFAITATGGPVTALLDLRGLVVSPAAAGSAGAAPLTAVHPRRLLDTGAGVPLAAGATRTVTVTGTAAGVPTDATAVLLSVGARNEGVATTLQVVAAGSATGEGTSALRVPSGTSRGNLVLVPVGTGGQVVLSSSRSAVRATLDVRGYLR